MNRREFMAGSAAAMAALGEVAPASASAQEATEYYELRRIELRIGPQSAAFNNYLRDAFIPAMTRAGVGPIGVFSPMYGPQSPSTYILIPHKSLESVSSAWAKLGADEEYHRVGAPVTAATAAAPAFQRFESSLMVAFPGTKLEVPEKKGRIFELRTYESHSVGANMKKVEMFTHGEIDIFRRAGLRPVFFGRTLIGDRLPNLTYMLVYDDIAAHDAAWGRFGGDPEWAKLRSQPGYGDAEIVSSISNYMLRPAGFSQI